VCATKRGNSDEIIAPLKMTKPDLTLITFVLRKQHLFVNQLQKFSFTQKWRCNNANQNNQGTVSITGTVKFMAGILEATGRDMTNM